MKTSVVLSLDSRRTKADGSFPIVLRITHHGKVSQINTGFFAKPTDWNEQARILKNSYKGTQSVTRLNNQLQKKKSEALDIIAKLDERKTLDTYTSVGLKQLIGRKPDQASFFKFAENVANELRKAKRIGNARSYESAIGALRKFVGGRDLTFLEINLAFLNRFEIHHLSKGNSYNGLAAYLRAIRAIYNLGIAGGTVDKELYPFNAYSIKTVKTRKRAISAKAIKLIEEMVLPTDHQLYHTRNYFLASFYMRGMSFADLAALKIANIVDGRIYYQRKKTDKPYNVKINERLQAILNIYLPSKTKEHHIFPIVKRESIEDQYKDIEWARRRFNKKLKKLAALCGIEENLTSYVSRHSFATIAKNLGMPTASISDMLGHADIKTTQVYLDSLSSEALDDLHEKVIKEI